MRGGVRPQQARTPPGAAFAIAVCLVAIPHCHPPDPSPPSPTPPSARVLCDSKPAADAPTGPVIDKTNILVAPDNFEPWRNAGYGNLAPKGWSEWSDLPAPYKYYEVKVDPKDVENEGLAWKTLTNWKTALPVTALLALPAFVFDVRVAPLTALPPVAHDARVCAPARPWWGSCGVCVCASLCLCVPAECCVCACSMLECVYLCLCMCVCTPCHRWL